MRRGGWMRRLRRIWLGWGFNWHALNMGISTPTKVSSIRDLIDFAIGGGWGKETEFAESQRVRVIRGTDFERIRNRRYEEIPTRFEKRSKVARRELQPGDIILEISGGSPSSGQSTGRSFYVSDDVLRSLGQTSIPASFCRLVRFDQSNIDARYAYYSLQEMYASGRAALYEQQSTGISNFQFEHFLDSEIISLPPLPEQRRIAHILGTLDDKIELNRRINDTLEEMARAVFKDWFVDFGPVRAKMEGREAYLPEEIWRLFPDRLVESELGSVPEGWGVKALDEVANYRNGLALQKFRPEPGEARLPVVKIAQLRSGVADSGEWASAGITPECVIDDGDVVFSWSGSLLVEVWTGGQAALNQHLFKVTSKGYPKWFYLQFTRHHLAEFQSIAADKTTTMGHIKRQHLREARCAVPDLGLIAAAANRLETLLYQSISNDIASRKLSELRDALLPNLVTGQAFES